MSQEIVAVRMLSFLPWIVEGAMRPGLEILM